MPRSKAPFRGVHFLAAVFTPHPRFLHLLSFFSRSFRPLYYLFSQEERKKKESILKALSPFPPSFLTVVAILRPLLASALLLLLRVHSARLAFLCIQRGKDLDEERWSAFFIMKSGAGMRQPATAIEIRKKRSQGHFPSPSLNDGMKKGVLQSSGK